MEKRLKQRELGQGLELSQAKSHQTFPQEPLHFVNMTPLSVNSKPSKDSIHSHVAKLAHQRIRRRRLIQFLQSKNARVEDGQRSEYESAAIDVREIAHGDTVNYSEIRPLSDSRATQPQVGPVDLLRNGSRDPFQSYPAQFTQHEGFLLNHFINHIVPHWAMFYPRSKSEPDYQQGMMLHWLPLALTEPGIMNGVFFAACRSLALLHHNSSHLQDSFKYSEAFIQSINQDIFKSQGSVQDSTILKVWLLASSEFHAGNVQGTGNHVKAIGEMVTRKGGLQKLELGGFLKQLILWQDRTFTSYVETSPTFSHMIEDADSGSTEHLSVGFRHPAVLCQFGVDMVNLLCDICAYTEHIDQVSLLSNNAARQALSSPVGEFEARLLILGSNYNNPSSVHVYSPVEESVFLALRVFLQMMPHDSSLPPMGCKLVAARMNSVLSKVVLLPNWDELAGLLLWVVFMAGIVSRAGATKEQELPEFFAGLRKQVDLPLRFDEISGDDDTYWISKLNELSSLLGVYSNEGVKLHLKRFLWVDGLCDVHSRDIWKGLEG